ncbi:MAG: Fic family protein [Candidatus Berkelbacteria bacterium]|nr:Fic family protein [Candidatus Berkelbacteria bacterium]
MITRPKDNKDLEKRAAIGVIRAARFVRRYAKSNKVIDVSTIRLVHKEIWRDVWPEIAGEYRIENLEISGSSLQLPHFKDVPKLMEKMDIEFAKKISKTGDECRGVIADFGEINDELINCIDKVVSLSTWVHHKITFIHPFREGNGRTARLIANLILERYGLVGISVKVERENKDAYIQALSQIDKMADYEPLKNLIYKGLAERYEGVAMKYYPFAKG